MVTGGDALVRIDVPRTVPMHQATVRVNGVDVTSTLDRDDAHARTPAWSADSTSAPTRSRRKRTGAARGRPRASLTLVNHPVTGPIFSGPQQQPFVCKTQTQAGLGFPQVDNQDGIGMRLFQTPGNQATPLIGWSKDCTVDRVVDYLYRTTGGQFARAPAGPLPGRHRADDDARRPHRPVRRPPRARNDQPLHLLDRDPGPAGRSRCTAGHVALERPAHLHVRRRRRDRTQPGHARRASALYDLGLSKGYAIVHSSGTRTSTHYNLVLGAETAIMTKERFIEGYGVPLYTVGVGGSGGAIQQYVYAQNYPGVIIDAAIPQRSYPDMVTQTIHVGDCELLEHYMDVTDGLNPKWATWANRTWLEGLAASNTRPNPYRGGLPGNSECVNGWRGLTPLALNPLYGTAGAGTEFYDPAVIAAVKWTHWDDLRNVYGVEPDGYAKVPWDNVGVQYGLAALKAGNVTPAEFLKLNATVGSWRESKDMVQEGCPFFPTQGCSNPATWDPWSRRNMRLSPDGGVTPAPRRAGNLDAANAAYTSGLVFRGAIDIPIIDARDYLEHVLDMHNSHQSFASRKRMLNYDGDASNQVIWFADARPSGRSSTRRRWRSR